MDICNTLKRWYPREKLAESLIPGVASGMALAISDGLWYRYVFKTPPHPRRCEITHLIRQNQTMRWLWRGAHISLLAPIAEEAVMRGMIYSTQKEHSPCSNTLTHIGINASLFALQHINFTACIRRRQFHSIKFLPNIFFSCLVFCSLAEVTNSLWAPTIAHMTINSIFFMHASRMAKIPHIHKAI